MILVFCVGLRWWCVCGCCVVVVSVFVLFNVVFCVDFCFGFSVWCFVFLCGFFLVGLGDMLIV